MTRQREATQKKIENLLGAIALYPVGVCAIARPYICDRAKFVNTKVWKFQCRMSESQNQREPTLKELRESLNLSQEDLGRRI